MAFIQNGRIGPPPPSPTVSGRDTILALLSSLRLTLFGDSNEAKQIFKLSFDRGRGLLIIEADSETRTTTPEQPHHMNTTIAKNSVTGLYFNGRAFEAPRSEAVALRPGTTADTFRLIWACPVEIEEVKLP